MNNAATDCLFQDLPAGSVIGLVGAGAFGSQLRRLAAERGFRVLICDPPKSLEMAEEVNDALHIEWGNGMGGCDFSGLETDTFLPPDALFRSADRVAIQVPLNDTTRGMIHAGLVRLCRGTVICFSDPAVLSDDVRISRSVYIPPEQ